MLATDVGVPAPPTRAGRRAAGATVRRVQRRPFYTTVWFWLLLLGSGVLWYVAWSSTQSTDDVPSVPSVSVVSTPSAAAIDAPADSGTTGPLPTLSAQPLG